MNISFLLSKTTMKTTKSQKTAISDKNSSSSIPNYFKTDLKESAEYTPSNVKSVYVHALLDKLQSFDDESASNHKNNSGRGNEKIKSNGCDPCQASDRVDKTNAGNECAKLRIKYEEVKKSYLKLSVRYTELMMKHEELVLVSTGTVRPNTEAEDFDGVSPTLSFSDGIFTENEIKCLQCIPLDKTKDSTFILNCIQYAYKNNAASLTKKTLKGTKARYETKEGDLVTVKPGKEPLTPEKVARIQELFIDRVTKSKCLAGEFGERVKQTNINKLIANAVKNVSNKVASKEVLSNQNADLDL